jgi:hypothetical protein
MRSLVVVAIVTSFILALHRTTPVAGMRRRRA